MQLDNLESRPDFFVYVQLLQGSLIRGRETLISFPTSVGRIIFKYPFEFGFGYLYSKDASVSWLVF